MKYKLYLMIALAMMGFVQCVIADQPPLFDALQATTLPAAQPDQLPRWRGFNLDEKFNAQWQKRPFREQDFQWIHELGFNFVRLPMDYRCWIVDGDWTKFDETTLKQIDDAVAYGVKYGIHVCLNFHRAPGYSVAKPPEATELWTDAKTQEICAMHWAEFARRYRGIPNAQLSFNLFNEPTDVPANVYVQVVKLMADAIHAHDPERLIICDGLKWAGKPVPELLPLHVAQATRGYTPMNVTHYGANWVDSQDYVYPTWPHMVVNGMLYAPGKPDIKPESFLPLVIDGPFTKLTQLRLHVQTVSSQATLVVRGDGNMLWEKAFVCGPGAGEWKQSEHKQQWDIYQCVYDRDYQVAIPAGTQRLEVAVTQGDWLRLDQIGLKIQDKPEHLLALQTQWDQQPAQIRFQPLEFKIPFVSSKVQGRQWLKQTTMTSWLALQQQGVGVMVGEFGCYNRTPHDVALAWMEDCLANWKQANWGWALWNFRGAFGILDSHRRDVDYENFHGHKLDRQMLDLLQKY